VCRGGSLQITYVWWGHGSQSCASDVPVCGTFFGTKLQTSFTLCFIFNEWVSLSLSVSLSVLIYSFSCCTVVVNAVFVATVQTRSAVCSLLTSLVSWYSNLPLTSPLFYSLTSPFYLSSRFFQSLSLWTTAIQDLRSLKRRLHCSGCESPQRNWFSRRATTVSSAGRCHQQTTTVNFSLAVCWNNITAVFVHSGGTLALGEGRAAHLQNNEPFVVSSLMHEIDRTADRNLFRTAQ
jgi:hypothetical protein